MVVWQRRSGSGSPKSSYCDVKPQQPNSPELELDATILFPVTVIAGAVPRQTGLGNTSLHEYVRWMCISSSSKAYSHSNDPW